MDFEAYPFEKLNKLLLHVKPNEQLSPIALTIGEPQFQTPLFIQEALKKSVPLLNKYPKTDGEEALKEAQRGFIKRRFGVKLRRSELLPTFGTREVLFNFPQFFLSNKKSPVMAFTNPFYQIYEGAAIASNAKMFHLNLSKENKFKPTINEHNEKLLKKCHLVIINSPNNPTTSVLSLEELRVWVRLSMKYGFALLNDECYSEIYAQTPPPSLLEASFKEGNEKFKNILVVNSISKRSSAPGLRSGFIAGDKQILKEYLRYRTYVGCASPLPLQMAAAAAWSDEAHVEEAREVYRENFALASEILGVKTPKASFYLYLHVKNGEKFAKKLYKKMNVKVLPAIYLGRGGIGEEYVRVALVYEPKITKEALFRIKEFLKGWN